MSAVYSKPASDLQKDMVKYIDAQGIYSFMQQLELLFRQVDIRGFDVERLEGLRAELNTVILGKLKREATRI